MPDKTKSAKKRVSHEVDFDLCKLIEKLGSLNHGDRDKLGFIARTMLEVPDTFIANMIRKKNDRAVANLVKSFVACVLTIHGNSAQKKLARMIVREMKEKVTS